MGESCCGSYKTKHCHSCCAPLSPEFKGASDKYCKLCTDEAGNLKSREEVLKGMACWLKCWQPDLDDATALKRAEHFMKAMPAWAE